MQRVGTRIVQGQHCEVFANADGEWFIKLNGDQLGKGDTVDKAIAQARTKINKSRVMVSVPFFDTEGKKLFGQTINLKTGEVIAVDESGNKHDMGRNGVTFSPDIPPATLATYVANINEMYRARNENSEITARWRINIADQVEKTIAADTRVRDSFEGLEPSDRYNMARNLILDNIDPEVVFKYANLSKMQAATIRRSLLKAGHPGSGLRRRR